MKTTLFDSDVRRVIIRELKASRTEKFKEKLRKFIDKNREIGKLENLKQPKSEARADRRSMSNSLITVSGIKTFLFDFKFSPLLFNDSH